MCCVLCLADCFVFSVSCVMCLVYGELCSVLRVALSVYCVWIRVGWCVIAFVVSCALCVVCCVFVIVLRRDG